MSARPTRSAYRTVSPMAKRAGSNVSNDIGPPAFGSGGFIPPISPKSMRIGWWPRRNVFHAHSASPSPGAKWSVSAITTFLPSAGGGSANQPLAGVRGVPGEPARLLVAW